MENYHVLDLIGEGSFGRVFKGRRKYSGQVVALKFIPKVGRSEKELKNLRREIEIMRTLHHGNIIEMLDSFETEKEVVAVTDYAEGELFQILEDDGSLPQEQVQSIACHLVSALYYLHSHRILHRDMKPQNILLGKGGIVKLCDFGFARAMSINTLVLTSIKGTPLYMSPELVEEKPYDHTADLWALGCILYELFAGKPPFYTNSIFQLVSLIIKDPVRWPKNMSPEFKDFLQGLLTKNPKLRLSWPYLLEHPFVKHGVNVSEEEKNLSSPFTQAPTASLILEKDRQAKELAHPPGTSKILRKAREKAKQESSKEGRQEAWTKEKGHQHGKTKVHHGSAHAASSQGVQTPSERIATDQQETNRPPTTEWEDKTCLNEAVEPTPRSDRIERDYDQAYPVIEVDSRKVLNKPEKKKNIENVKLTEEDADSDDEWQGLVEITDTDNNDPESITCMMSDQVFMTKLTTRLKSSTSQVMDSLLEGASRLRPVLRVIINLVTLKCDVETLLKFLTTISCPKILVDLIEQILEKPAVKEQTWSQQILVDLITSVHAYLGSQVLSPENTNQDSLDEFLNTFLKLVELLSRLLSQRRDNDMRLREQCLLCLIFVCETLERSEHSSFVNLFFDGVSKHKSSLEAILVGCTFDDHIIKRLEDALDGDNEKAQHRMEDMICLNVTALAALTNLPIQILTDIEGKKSVANAVAELLLETRLSDCNRDYLLLLNHPSTCSSVLKVLYLACQVNTPLCLELANNHTDMQTLLGVLQGKVEIADMELNSVLEMDIHLLSVIIMKVQGIPAVIADAVPFLVSIFIDSQLASHTAAAALLFHQLLCHGTMVEVQPEDLIEAALSEFTDLTQICVRCPFDFGVLDGIVLLLNQLVTQGEVPVGSLFLESGIWSILWHRVAQMINVQTPDTDIPLHDLEADNCGFPLPDWGLMSIQGLLGVLQMAVSILTKEAFQIVPSLTMPDGIINITLMHLLSEQFLHIVASSAVNPENGLNDVIDIVLEITQICCFPFAIDTNDEQLSSIQTCFASTGLLPKLLQACVTYLRPELLELPLGLISRLVLGETAFVDQFAKTVIDMKAEPYFESALRMTDNSCVSVLCDTICICSHVARTSPIHVQMITRILQGQQQSYALLEKLLSADCDVVRARSCSLLGNMMKHSNIFYPVLKDRPKLLNGLIKCLKDVDPNVRKVSSYAVGNAGFHSAELYLLLRPSIRALIALLEDPVAKTRANAASALGNMAIHSADLSASLIQDKAVQSVLETACHDSQYGVQECALTALRSMCSQKLLKKELKKLKAVDKLSNMSDGSGSSSVRTRGSLALSKSSGRHSITTVMQHCNKLLRQLSADP